MARYNGLIIPQSYNDYFSRSDPGAIKSLITQLSDAAFNTESSNPIQNRVVAALIPNDANVNNKLTTQTELETKLEQEKNRAETIENEIKIKIPNTASEENQLADKNFVNSTVGTNTANYIYKTNTSGENVPFDSIVELEEYSGLVTNNDYAFVTGTDENGNKYFDRYKAKSTGGVITWGKEYRLNNSSFTAVQWAAIESGITAEKVAKIPDYTVAQIDDTKTDRNTALSSLEIHNRLQSTISDYLEEFKTHYYKAGIFENSRTSGNAICVDMSTVDDEWDSYDHEVLINFGMYEDGDHICGFYSDICGAYDSSTSLTPNSTSEFRCGGTTQTRQNNLQIWIPCHRYIYQHFSNACDTARFNVMAWRRLFKGD